jgi:hypothetical protein
MALLLLGGVILDSHGNVYDSTFNGGSGGGTVYELQPSGSNWNYSILYSFQGVTGPVDALTMDASGNLYGTVLLPGADANGSVFKLTPGSDGWSYTDLHDFTGGADGGGPSCSVTLDRQGNVYAQRLAARLVMVWPSKSRRRQGELLCRFQNNIGVQQSLDSQLWSEFSF